MKVIKFILIFFLLICFISTAYAVAGVSPAVYDVNFKPNLKYDFVFNFIFDEGVESAVYSDGELAKYIELDRKYIIGSQAVVARLKLPGDIEKPGIHKIYIGAKQIPNEEQQGIGLIADVRGTIKIHVPYPGKYAEIDFTTTNANIGENVSFTINIKNLGKEDITANAFIEIENYEAGVETLNLGTKFIESTTSKKFYRELDTRDYKPGDYNATAIVYYGGEEPVVSSKIFRLGELYIKILDYTKEFKRNTINRFNVEVESFWNDPIENLFANITIIDYNINFLTPSVRIEPWSRAVLEGYFDTTSIESEKFKANIILNYAGKTTSEIVELRFKREINYILYIIIGLILIIGLIIIILLKRKRKNEKQKKKK